MEKKQPTNSVEVLSGSADSGVYRRIFCSHPSSSSSPRLLLLLVALQNKNISANFETYVCSASSQCDHNRLSRRFWSSPDSPSVYSQIILMGKQTTNTHQNMFAVLALVDLRGHCLAPFNSWNSSFSERLGATGGSVDTEATGLA